MKKCPFFDQASCRPCTDPVPRDFLYAPKRPREGYQVEERKEVIIDTLYKELVDIKLEYDSKISLTIYPKEEYRHNTWGPYSVCGGAGE